MPVETFWQLTPRLVVNLIRRWRDAQRAADRRAGEVAAMIYNAHRDAKKDPKGRTWIDVFPQWKEKKPVQSEDQMFAAMMMWAQATKGRKR